MSIESSMIVGAAQLAGREDLACSTALETLTIALSMSVSSSNSS